jgi:hypothetical protein
MAAHLGRTSLGANSFLAGCVSMVMINISAALIHLSRVTAAENALADGRPRWKGCVQTDQEMREHCRQGATLAGQRKIAGFCLPGGRKCFTN